MDFDWHEDKRQKTLAERSIDFVDMISCFFDPDHLVQEDIRKDYGEQRFNMLARKDNRVFHLTFTIRGNVFWIISARKANDREVRRYETA